MGVSARTYPKNTVKKIVKAHANKSVGRDVDVLVSEMLLPTLILG